MEDKKEEILRKEIYRIIFGIDNGVSVEHDAARVVAAENIYNLCLAEGSASGWVKNWIKALDKTPEDSGLVLVSVVPTFKNTRPELSAYGDLYISYYRKDRNVFEVWGAGRESVTDMYVTHWMPLPLPPGQLDKEDGRAIKTPTEAEIITKNVELFKSLLVDNITADFILNNRIEVHFDASQQYLCYINYKDGDGAYGLGATFLEALNNGINKYKTSQK